MKVLNCILLLLALLGSCQTKTTITHTLNSPTLIDIFPDSLALVEIEQKWGEEDFPVFMDDVMWYHSELMIMVDTLRMDRISTESRNLKLIGGEKTWEIEMDTTAQKWRYIYFDGTDFIEKDAIAMKDYLIENY
ncbi:Hypothetical protein I595_933 [Croceitalea dokdonensis DOKDO 023]|uniref:Lipoprotein n=1 Tax=Croceitalea dokdonensis DOKDO 023 TaxID=1300341 RepID=A0A0P7B2L9_9FLAO|nr:hypothetical protein [Croceitalea dokdonensis]KPM32515.1 Hypothetical protein I595_933 [Croceitalea dokdonensis DOKDO 023]